MIYENLADLQGISEQLETRVKLQFWSQNSYSVGSSPTALPQKAADLQVESVSKLPGLSVLVPSSVAEFGAQGILWKGGAP